MATVVTAILAEFSIGLIECGWRRVGTGRLLNRLGLGGFRHGRGANAGGSGAPQQGHDKRASVHGVILQSLLFPVEPDRLARSSLNKGAHR